ncbi:MAG TPA: 30S ribosomal protein S9 [Aggregatilinea sp.]|jgi:small subunit ribosomal protein S9|uniref:30S ribosomal protein S9 n=1 Tax=Aggregatilinea sp. TaxID=2806333 RepID=UPI002BF6DCAD|nr:30S ribosomal protein S9 [Aggregatilinea sp.]HML22151.1 30S ribosomal protein S9 [Aggregatilinea sp.]
MANQYYEGIGRRKRSTARVRLWTGGNGSVVINDKPGEDFLSREGDLALATAPLRAVAQEAAYNITVKVNGGGVTGQRDAIQLGIARALVEIEPEWRSTLRQGDFLSRDPRIKERKKPGLKRARKAPTYTKR